MSHQVRQPELLAIVDIGTDGETHQIECRALQRLRRDLVVTEIFHVCCEFQVYVIIFIYI
jgi:hypothetical protein